MINDNKKRSVNWKKKKKGKLKLSVITVSEPKLFQKSV